MHSIHSYLYLQAIRLNKTGWVYEDIWPRDYYLLKQDLQSKKQKVVYFSHDNICADRIKGLEVILQQEVGQKLHYPTRQKYANFACHLLIFYFIFSS